MEFEEWRDEHFIQIREGVWETGKQFLKDAWLILHQSSPKNQTSSSTQTQAKCYTDTGDVDVVNEPCEWQHETDWDSDYWQTKCGNAFQFTDGGPIENHFRFCPYCGEPNPVIENTSKPLRNKKTEEQS